MVTFNYKPLFVVSSVKSIEDFNISDFYKKINDILATGHDKSLAPEEITAIVRQELPICCMPIHDCSAVYGITEVGVDLLGRFISVAFPVDVFDKHCVHIYNFFEQLALVSVNTDYSKLAPYLFQALYIR